MLRKEESDLRRFIGCQLISFSQSPDGPGRPSGTIAYDIAMEWSNGEYLTFIGDKGTCRRLPDWKEISLDVMGRTLTDVTMLPNHGATLVVWQFDGSYELTINAFGPVFVGSD